MATGTAGERAAVLSWARDEPLPEKDTGDALQVFLQTDEYLYYEPPSPPARPPRQRFG